MMEAADVKHAAATAARAVRQTASALNRSPALAVAAAFAAGFLGGLVLRRFERPKTAKDDSE
jgi:hypothetical protein